LLLVLDNCEHLVEACAHLVDALLRACSGLRVLTTSRDPLRVAGEASWRVPSLPVPPADDRTAAEVSAAAAVRLFAERAAAAAPGFVVDDANAPAVARICRRLDGVPLAIELAAVRVRALSTEQIADRLEEAFGPGRRMGGGQFGLLAAGERSALPRQQTLRASIDWSHDLLAEPERALFRRLAVFAGGFTLEAAEAVCPGECVGEADVLGLLTALVDKSLVVAELQPATGRYRLLETLRAYALERLAVSGEAAMFERRHAAHVLALAEEAEPHLWGEEQVAWFARLEAERDNMRAALGRCLAHDADGGLRLAGSLWRFWQVRGPLGEGQRWLEQLLARTGAPTVGRVRALLGAGSLARLCGDTPAARARLERGLALARRVGDRRYVAWLLRDLGQLFAFSLRDYARARALLEEGLALVRDRGDGRATAVVLHCLGALARWGGDYAQARALVEEALPLARAAGDRYVIGGSLTQSALLALVEGDVGRAEAMASEALAVAQAIGAAGMVSFAQRLLGRAAQSEGDLEEAVARYEAGLAAAREAGDRENLVECLGFMAPVAQLRGESDRATALLREGLDLADGAGDPVLRALVHHSLGVVAVIRGDNVQATAWVRESLPTWRELHQPLDVARSLEVLALAAAGLSEPVRALRLLGAAAAIRAAIGGPPPPVDRPGLDAARAAATAALPADVAAAAWSVGQWMTLDEAVSEALAVGQAAPVAAPATAVAGSYPAGLTGREVEVLRLVAAGRSNRAIAVSLCLSPRTVERHIEHIYRKIDAHNKAEATAFAFRHRLTLTEATAGRGRGVFPPPGWRKERAGPAPESRST
jgi:predicted ATPase/DNA-binding CsgD family transcriptional regulator